MHTTSLRRRVLQIPYTRSQTVKAVANSQDEHLVHCDMFPYMAPFPSNLYGLVSCFRARCPSNHFVVAKASTQAFSKRAPARSMRGEVGKRYYLTEVSILIKVER